MTRDRKWYFDCKRILQLDHNEYFSLFVAKKLFWYFCGSSIFSIVVNSLTVVEVFATDTFSLRLSDYTWLKIFNSNIKQVKRKEFDNKMYFN